ncbi:MAG: hypothetical protein ACR2RV_24645 [Verrucomicrobiales bacterium]
MKILLTFTLAILCQIGHADEGAIDVAKTHLDSNLKGDYKKLTKTYAPKINLMAGHEFLKEEYGLAGAGGRAKGGEVERGKLIEAMTKASADRPERPQERVEKMLKSLRYEVIEVQKGDFVTEASDPVGTPDGKLHFSIKKGDVLLKVSPPKGDFLLLHLRKKAGEWSVVSEYLD